MKKKEKKEKEQSPSFVPFKITEHYNHSTDIEYLNHDLLREGSAKLWQHLQELARSGKLKTILIHQAITAKWLLFLYPCYTSGK